MKFHRTFLFALVPCALALFSGCKDKEEIKVYRVSKDQPDSAAPESPAPGHPPMGGGMPAMGAPAQGGGGEPEQAPQISSTPPANWEAQPLSSMRQASYLVKGENGATADISMVILSGGAGGVLDNVNRWLSQLGQPAITEEKLGQTARHVSLPLGDVTVVDLEGLPQGSDPTKDGRIVGGIASNADQTIFFKMRGNAALAESQKEEFIKWIGTVRMIDSADKTSASPAAATAPAASPNLPSGHPALPAAGATSLPAGHPAMPSTGSASPEMSATPDSDQPKWEVPEGWKSVKPSSMRVASFVVAGQNGEALDISVSALGGDGGGDLLNVNRWRQQIGLSPVAEGDLKGLVVPIKAKDGEILSVDLAGPKARMLVAWAKIDGKTWFFKLTGPDALAAGEKEKFAKFLQSVQFHP